MAPPDVPAPLCTRSPNAEGSGGESRGDVGNGTRSHRSRTISRNGIICRTCGSLLHAPSSLILGIVIHVVPHLGYATEHTPVRPGGDLERLNCRLRVGYYNDCMCLAVCQVPYYVQCHNRWGETITERLFSCDLYSRNILRQHVYSRIPLTMRNALRGPCGCHEVNVERTQLVPHPPKSVGLQPNDRFSRRSRDCVRDAVGGRRDPFQCEEEPYSTCRSKSFTNNACVSGYLPRPRLNSLTTDWLSTLIRTCARRNARGAACNSVVTRETARTSLCCWHA